MAKDGVLLLQTSDGWQAAGVGSAKSDFQTIAMKNAAPAELAAAVTTFHQEAKVASNAVVIAVHSTATVAAPFEVTDGATDRAALLYQFEAALPFDLEDGAADFSSNAASHIGVALPTAKWQPLVEEIEAAGLLVMSIIPAALAAMQQRVGEFDQGRQAVLWHSGNVNELCILNDGQLVSWRHLPADSTAVERAIGMEQLVDAEPMTTSLITTESAPQVPETIAVKFGSQEESVRDFAGLILSGKQTPWIELRRDVLANGDPNRAYRSVLNWLMLAAAALLIMFSIACWLRAGRYENRVADVEQKQRDLFKRAFPAKRVPAALMSRLRSEHARFVRSREGSNDVPFPTSVVDPTFRILSSLPEDVPVRVTSLKVENGTFDLGIEVTEFDDVGVIRSALRANGMVVDRVGASVRVEDGDAGDVDIVSRNLVGRISNGDKAEAGGDL